MRGIEPKSSLQAASLSEVCELLMSNDQSSTSINIVNAKPSQRIAPPTMDIQ